MRFGVLGPLVVWNAGGDVVRIPELKVRALLAALLVHEGRAVSTSRLIDDLWGESLPGNPAGALQLKVSRLRQALDDAEPGARGLVVSQPPGYALATSDGAVDAARFRSLCARARTEAEPSARVRLLDDALALWRGPAVADFEDEPFARSMIDRLHEERLVALEERAEARLELGEHAVLIGELGDLVRSHPLRQRLRAAQLRALYAAGRQDEALESYRDLRQRLVDELGLDPGAELVALHRSILEQDPELDPAPGSAASARPRTNLPAALDPLIGRDEAVAQASSLLQAGRFVTLTGPGGVGKTRLAVEVARQLADGFGEGAWFVELAVIDRPLAAAGHADTATADVVDVVATALGIHDDAAPGAEPRAVDPAERLAGRLRDRNVLLVLDNAEHVITAVADVCAVLLRTAPELRVLVTSREPLDLPGEWLWPVPPMDLPRPGPVTEYAAVRRSGAVRLFEARVAAVVPGFTVGPDNVEAVVGICRRLDGIPLALELAAARVRTLGVHELAARLDDRFGLLSTGRRGAPARQQTLQAMIDWSWDPLTDPERQVLRRLAVFADGCALPAAEELCSGGSVTAADTVDLLSRLVDRSLVVVAEGAAGVRYRLLETVKAYGVDRLAEAGESDQVRQRHLRHFVDLAERAAPHLFGHDQRSWLERLDADTANLRAALETAVRTGDAESALRLVDALAWYWFLRGRIDEARRSLTTALEVDDAQPARVRVSAVMRARVVTWRSGMTMLANDNVDPVSQRTVAFGAYDDVDDPAGLARAEWFLSLAQLSYGDPSVHDGSLDRALSTLQSLDDRWGTAAVLSVRAQRALLHGDLATLRSDALRSLEIFAELGDQWGQLQASNTLAVLAEVNGEYDRAGRLRRDGLRLAEGLGMWTEVTGALSGLGRLAMLAGDHPAADEWHERAMRLAAGQSDRQGEVFAEIGLGLGARRQGDLAAAESHLRRCLDWCRSVTDKPGTALLLAELGFVAEQLGDVGAALAWHTDGFTTARELGDLRAMALALEGLAGARAIGGRPSDAARLLGAAAAARDAAGVPLPDAERGDVDRITAAVQGVLGEAAFLIQFDRGRALDPDAIGAEVVV